MPRGRPAYRPQQILAVVEAAAVLGQVPSYRSIARAVGMNDWRDVKAICRKLEWPSPATPRQDTAELQGA